jgi:hypothetical protein
MKPQFKDIQAWEQAQLLMQPAFIRVLDNIRKQLEESSWQGTYQEKQLPYPGYELCLSHQDHSIIVDIWQLCYQVCFINYSSPTDSLATNSSQLVAIDTSLIGENGEVDWHRLDSKAEQLVKNVFINLP